MKDRKSIDWGMIIVPAIIMVVLSAALMLVPDVAGRVIGFLSEVLNNKLGFFYILMGLGIFLIGLGVAFSKYGKIRLGKLDKPKYSNFSWGAMIFTSTMSAELLYWSLTEWAYYYESAPFAMTDMTLAQKQDVASAYPLFHWGPIAWMFYLLPAVAYGYMFFVKKRGRATLSAACKPILKNKADGILGKIIDIFAIVGIIIAIATTFSLSTPLISKSLSVMFGIEATDTLTICLVIGIGLVFGIAVLLGMKAISKLASLCVILFFVLAGIFLVFGPKIYIIESAISGMGYVLNNFFSMATWLDPLRESGAGGMGFPQSWTVFYWAYWIACFQATPFFIARISEGRTIKEVLLGGLGCGIAGTFTAFLIFGGFGMYQQTHGVLDIAGELAAGADPADVIMSIFGQLPVTNIALIVLCIAIVTFCASTFDSITLVVAGHCEKLPEKAENPRKGIRLIWAVVFLLLPIALIFSQSTLELLKAVLVISAFPLGIVMIIIVAGFIKEIRKDVAENKDLIE